MLARRGKAGLFKLAGTAERPCPAQAGEGCKMHRGGSPLASCLHEPLGVRAAHENDPPEDVGFEMIEAGLPR